MKNEKTKVIKVKMDTWSRLSKYGEFQDSADDVIKKILVLYENMLEKEKNGDM